MTVPLSSGLAAKAKKVKTSAGELLIDSDSAEGTVSSKRSECERGRKVKLRNASAGGKAVRSAQTDKEGEWEITIQLAAATYYTEVTKASRIAKNGAKLSCGAAKSKKIAL